jgi:hypothetical protein
MMKRGLSTLDTECTPVSLFQDRQERLRQVARDRGLDAVFVYGDVSGGGDIAFLTHTTLYWGHGILVIPAEGPTVLVMTLSPRTHDWFRETGVLGEMISGPQLGPLLRQLSIDRDYAAVGIVEQSDFPASMLEAVSDGREVLLVDLGSPVRELRSRPDEAALADVRQTARLGARGLEAALAAAQSADMGRVRADSEYAMRTGGAWDATTVITRSTDNAVAIQLRCQLRDSWYGAERFLRGGNDANPAEAQSLYQEMLRQLRPGTTEAKLLDSVLAFAEARGLSKGMLVDIVLETAPDVEARLVFPETDQGFAEGSVVHAALWGWDLDGYPTTAMGDTFLLSKAGYVRLSNV